MNADHEILFGKAWEDAEYLPATDAEWRRRLDDVAPLVTDLAECPRPGDGPKIINGHVLLASSDCDCIRRDMEGRCPVCDWGLSVCAACGTYEAGLDAPCTGKPPKVEPAKCLPGDELADAELELLHAEQEADFYGRNVIMADHLEALRKRVERLQEEAS